MSSETPEGPRQSFGSEKLSKYFEEKKKNTFPEVVVVKNPSEVRRITVKNEESGKNRAFSTGSINQKKKLPANLN